jgi:hypothetical protein
MATLSGLKEMNENPETKRQDRSDEAETAQGQSEEMGVPRALKRLAPQTSRLTAGI